MTPLLLLVACVLASSQRYRVQLGTRRASRVDGLHLRFATARRDNRLRHRLARKPPEATLHVNGRVVARSEQREGLHSWRPEAEVCVRNMVSEKGKHGGVVCEIVRKSDGSNIASK